MCSYANPPGLSSWLMLNNFVYGIVALGVTFALCYVALRLRGCTSMCLTSE